ncbi:MAG: F0F1 ATP synthase subunit epsilon [Candidatus Pacebacteria bacterium]|nr:F0F1 ATP synthase subunit epsilon [Candidatus Paceibacterota bacterium]
MADNTFHLVVASVGKSMFDSRAQSVTVPGASGVMTILPHHEPIVTTLKEGTISVRDQEGTVSTFDIDSGVLECANNRVVVLL